MSDDTRHDKRAAVIGGGSWGTALAHLMAVSGAHVKLWLRNQARADELNETRKNARYLGDKDIHEGVEAVTDLAAAARWSEVIIVAIPSNSFREVAFELGRHTTGEQILLSATKGLEAEHLTRMTEVLREETCCLKVGAISGPNLADEVMANQPAATVIASPFEEVISKGAKLLGGPTLRVYGNHDVVGAEIFGALKNPIAIASGAVAGLGLGANSLSLLLTRALAEISRFAEQVGAAAHTGLGLAGVGDLIATCTSPLSRNNTLGRLLAKGRTLEAALDEMDKTAEGVNTTHAVMLHAKRLGVDMPITQAVHRVLFEGHAVREAMGDLMARRSRYEHSERPIDAPAPVRGSIIERALVGRAAKRG